MKRGRYKKVKETIFSFIQKDLSIMYHVIPTQKQRGEIHLSLNLVSVIINNGRPCLFYFWILLKQISDK